MKFVATALALNLLVANAFVVQTSRNAMQPLHADYMNRSPNQGGTAVQQRGMQQNNNQRDMQQNNNQRGMQQNYNQRGTQQNNNQRGMQGNNMQGNNMQGNNMQRNNMQGNNMQRNNMQGNNMQQNNNQRNNNQRNNNQRNNNQRNMQQNNNQRAMQPNTRTPALDEKYSPVNGAYPTVQSTANTPFRPPRYDDRSTMHSGTRSTQDIFYDITPVEVQGGSLKTCAFADNVGRATVLLKTTGRPLNANVELWQGPDNTPQKMSVYLEDGDLRPFRATIETNGSANAVAIRNTAKMEFPLTAGIECDMSQSVAPSEMLLANTKFRTVQGGAVYTTPFPPAVQSVQIAIRTDGRPLTARVELLQGPNNNKQVMEVYTEDGSVRPFYVIVDTPGAGNVVRIVNTATVEFPLTAATEAYIIDESMVGQDMHEGMSWS